MFISENEIAEEPKNARFSSGLFTHRIHFVIAAAFLLFSGIACDQTKSLPDTPTKEKSGASETATKPRVAVGQNAPTFRLLNQHSVEISLGDLLTKGKVALVFYRSADW